MIWIINFLQATQHKTATHPDEHPAGENVDFADFTSFDETEPSNLQLKVIKSITW